MDLPPNMCWTIIRKYVNRMKCSEFDYLKKNDKILEKVLFNY